MVQLAPESADESVDSPCVYLGSSTEMYRRGQHGPRASKQLKAPWPNLVQCAGFAIRRCDGWCRWPCRRGLSYPRPGGIAVRVAESKLHALRDPVLKYCITKRPA